MLNNIWLRARAVLKTTSQISLNTLEPFCTKYLYKMAFSEYQFLKNIENSLHIVTSNIQRRFKLLCKCKQINPPHHCGNLLLSLINGKIVCTQVTILGSSPCLKGTGRPQCPGLTSSATTQDYIQGLVLAYPNVYPIFVLLEYAKELILRNDTHNIFMTLDGCKIFQRSFSKGVVMMLYQKPDQWLIAINIYIYK